MRRLPSALLLVLTATLAGSDRLLCPDGCSDESSQEAGTPPSALADCLACRNAISTAPPAFDVAAAGFTEREARELPQQLADPKPLPIDHPPRIA